MQSLFHTYITAGVQASLARVQTAEYIVPEADRQQAWHILSFALNVPAAWPVTRDLLLALAPKMEQAGFREEWIPYLEKGLHCAQDLGDDQAAAECELQIGLLYRLMSRFEEAHEWTTASVAHFATQGDGHGQARTLNELAWLEHLQHRYEDAICHVEKAQAILEEGDPERGMSYRVQGMVAMGQRKWQQAEQFHLKALAIFKQIQDFRKAAWSMQNVGYALSELGHLDEALRYFTQAADSLIQLEDQYHWSIVQMNLGLLHLRRAEATTAQQCLSIALKTFEKHGDKLNQARVLTNLGLSYLHLQDYSTAQDVFCRAANLYETLGDRIWQINALDGLALAFIGGQQYTQAISIIEEALEIMPEIETSSYYHNLLDKLTSHRQEAQLAKEALSKLDKAPLTTDQ